MPYTIKKGATIKVTVTHRDFDGALFNPDTHEYTIYDPSDVLQDTETTPTQLSTGVFYYYFDVPSDAAAGTWRVKAKAVGSTFTSIEEKTFKVIA